MKQERIVQGAPPDAPPSARPAGALPAGAGWRARRGVPSGWWIVPCALIGSAIWIGLILRLVT